MTAASGAVRRPLRVAVVGAGPAGLAAADRLARAGADVDLFEASSRIGGLAGTRHLWGRDVDVGPHIVAGGPRDAMALWADLLGDGHRCVPLRRGLAMHGTIVPYPPRPAALRRALGTAAWTRAGSAAVAARLRRRRMDAATSAASWIEARYGRPLYDALLRPYVEKLWGLPGEQVDAGFARALLAAGPAAAAPDVAMPCAAAGDAFAYPRDGTGGAWRRLADRIGARARLHLDAPVDAIEVVDGAVAAVCARGVRHPVDRVVSTMPLGALTRALGEAPGEIDAAPPRSRHAVVVHLRMDAAPVLPYTWVYLFDRALAAGRVTDTRAWGVPADGHDDAIIMLELWLGDDDALWSATDAALIDAAGSDLAASGLFPGARVRAGHVTRLRGALPVPEVGIGERLAPLRAAIARVRGLASVGRHGGFAFNSIAESLADGLAAADAALGTAD